MSNVYGREGIYIFYLVEYVKSCKKTDRILVRVNKDYSAKRKKEFEDQLMKELAHITGETLKNIKLVSYSPKT